MAEETRDLEKPITASPALGRKLVQGSFTMIFLRALVRFLGFASIVIVARLIPPEDIGLSALAASVVLGLNQLHNLGLRVALIRKDELTANDLNTVWTFSLMRGILKALLIVLLAPHVAAFFNEPRLTYVLYILAATSVCTGFSNVGTVEFHRKLQYARLFWLRLGSKLAYFVTVIATAFVLQSYWALISGMVTERIVAVLLSYLMHKFRPRFSWKPDKDLFMFSFWYWLHGVFSFLSHRSDTFVVGRMMGIADLGFYDISSRLAKTASAEVSSPVAVAVRPVYARLSENLKDLRRVYLHAAEGLVLLGLPAMAMIVVAAEPIIEVLLGAKWLSATPLVQALACVGIFRMLLIQNQTLLFQIGGEKFVTALALIRLMVLLPCLYIGVSNWGLMGAAAAVILATFAIWLSGQMFILSRLEIDIHRILIIFWRPMISAVAMGTILWALLENWLISPISLSETFKLCIVIIISAAAYISLLLFFWLVAGQPKGVLRETLMIIYRRFASLGVGRA